MRLALQAVTGNTVQYVGSLTGGDGMPLSAELVTLTVAGVQVDTAVTNSTGDFSGSFTYLTVGTFTLTASFAGATVGNVEYGPSTATAPFTITTPTYGITLLVNGATQLALPTAAGPVTFTGTGSLPPGSDLQLAIEDESGTVAYATLAGGDFETTATLSSNPTNAVQTYTFTATGAGYTSNPVTVTVAPGTTAQCPPATQSVTTNPDGTCPPGYVPAPGCPGWCIIGPSGLPLLGLYWSTSATGWLGNAGGTPFQGSIAIGPSPDTIVVTGTVSELPDGTTVYLYKNFQGIVPSNPPIAQTTVQGGAYQFTLSTAANTGTTPQVSTYTAVSGEGTDNPAQYQSNTLTLTIEPPTQPFITIDFPGGTRAPLTPGQTFPLEFEVVNYGGIAPGTPFTATVGGQAVSQAPGSAPWVLQTYQKYGNLYFQVPANFTYPSGTQVSFIVSAAGTQSNSVPFGVGGPPPVVNPLTLAVNGSPGPVPAQGSGYLQYDASGGTPNGAVLLQLYSDAGLTEAVEGSAYEDSFDSNGNWSYTDQNPVASYGASPLYVAVFDINASVNGIPPISNVVEVDVTQRGT